MEFTKKILCIGAGYVGGPTMAVIAAKCPTYKVIIADINKEKISAWQSDELPIYEPGLLDVVKKVRGKNLFFTTEIAKSINDSDIIFVSVNTPTKTFGEGKGRASDLQYLENTARSILENSKTNKIIVEKSTLPVKTAEALEKILGNNKNGVHFEIISNPEFLAEGSAIKDLELPDRVLIGSRETESGLRAREEIVGIYSNWVPKEKIVTSNIWSSELSKLVANAFLAQRISSINSISALCEKTGANISEISIAVGADTRVGNKFLNASIGFGGSCFKKDILNLVYICESLGLYEVAQYWESVISINDYQEKRFVKRMLTSMFNTIAGKKIVLFGFAFKANTGDTRETPAYYVAKMLIEERAKLFITDPKAISNAKSDLSEYNDEQICFIDDPYKAVENADAIAIMTEWDIYKILDYKKVYESMRKPAYIFDGRNILNGDELQKIGFNYFAIGK